MGWLGSGVLLWSLAHLLKRVAPGWRARLGSAGRPLVAVSIVLSVVLMILGYQQAEGPVWWGRQSALVGINNLLVLIGFYMISGFNHRCAHQPFHPASAIDRDQAMGCRAFVGQWGPCLNDALWWSTDLGGAGRDTD